MTQKLHTHTHYDYSVLLDIRSATNVHSVCGYYYEYNMYMTDKCIVQNMARGWRDIVI